LKRSREVRAAAVADEPRDVLDAHRALLGEQLRPDRESPRGEVLAEARLRELLVGPLELAGRARQRACDLREREVATVVADDHDPREQVQTPPRGHGFGTHARLSDVAGEAGRSARAAQPA
jgi:hypothetical protein